MSLDDYLSLDDYTMTEFFKACASSSDDMLKLLGQGLADRRLFKGTDVTDMDRASLGQFTARATEKVRKLGLEPEYAFVPETAADTPYKPYDPDASRPATQIYVETSSGQKEELSLRSDAVAQLRKRCELVRYFYPESIRDQIDNIAAQTLTKENA